MMMLLIVVFADYLSNKLNDQIIERFMSQKKIH